MGCNDAIALTRPRFLVLVSLVLWSVFDHSTSASANMVSQKDAYVIGDVVEKFKAVGLEMIGVSRGITNSHDLTPEAIMVLDCLDPLKQQVLILSSELHNAMMMTALSSVMKNREDESAAIQLLTDNLSRMFKEMRQTKDIVTATSGTCFRYAIVTTEGQKLLGAIDATYSRVGPIAARLGVVSQQ
jgi:hypothetical protein